MYVSYTYGFISCQREGDFMKIGKDMAFMLMGAGAVLAYQKYNKPVMKKVEEVADSAMKKANKKLEDMMQKSLLMETFLCVID